MTTVLPVDHVPTDEEFGRAAAEIVKLDPWGQLLKREGGGYLIKPEGLICATWQSVLTWIDSAWSYRDYLDAWDEWECEDCGGSHDTCACSD